MSRGIGEHNSNRKSQLNRSYRDKQGDKVIFIGTRVIPVTPNEKARLVLAMFVYYNGIAPTGRELVRWRKYLQRNPERAESILASMERKAEKEKELQV